MPGLQYQHNKDLVLQLAEYAIIAAAVAPDIIQLAFQLLTPLSGIVGADDTLIEISEDLGGSLFIQFF